MGLGMIVVSLFGAKMYWTWLHCARTHNCSRLAHLCTIIDRCYYHWDVIAALRHNKSYDLFFSGYILICFGIVMEGIIRFCPHYFGSGMITLSIVVWVRA